MLNNSCKRTEKNEEEEQGQSCGCCEFKKIRLCSYKCWQFFMSCVVSFLAIVIAFWGLIGGFRLQDHTFYSTLITFVLGVWCPSPSMKPEKKLKKPGDIVPAHESYKDYADRKV